MKERRHVLRQRTRAEVRPRFRQASPREILVACERGLLSWMQRMAWLSRHSCEGELVVIEPDVVARHLYGGSDHERIR
jgi:hypothetical protein